MKYLIINPGSTSTKISVFENNVDLFTESVFHDAPKLLSFKTTNEQLPFRKKVVLDLLEKYHIDINDIDVFVGRGGCAYSQEEGVMEIDENLFRDTASDVGGSDHPAKLGTMMAYEFGKEFNKPMYTVNPTNVDELIDVARLTGIKGVYRRAQSHVLNQKGIARLHCKKVGAKYEESSFIVCHIDGGITISAHLNGRMIDGTEGAGGDGPFTPTRLGSIPVMEVAKYLETHSCLDVEAMCSRSGGFVSHFGTSDANKIHDLVLSGDEHATLVWQTMIYQLCKSIGAMAVVLKGNVDAILLTGGLVRFSDVVAGVKERCGWLSPIFTYSGEVEQEAMYEEALEVVEGRKRANSYSGSPIFKGFDWDKN